MPEHEGHRLIPSLNQQVSCLTSMSGKISAYHVACLEPLVYLHMTQQALMFRDLSNIALASRRIASHACQKRLPCYKPSRWGKTGIVGQQEYTYGRTYVIQAITIVARTDQLGQSHLDKDHHLAAQAARHIAVSRWLHVLALSCFAVTNTLADVLA